MKTAVSVPDDVFDRVERLARREGRSRSDVYSSALRDSVARHSPDEVTDAVDRVVADIGAPPLAKRNRLLDRFTRSQRPCLIARSR